MSFLPETQKSHNEVMDLLVDACQKVVSVVDAPGLATYHDELMLDTEKAWWKTHIINSPTFARFAYQLKEFERLASDSFNNMCGPRAQVIARQILDIGLNYRYSIDAKSSESLRNKQNTQATLIDKLQKTTVQHAHTLKDDMKKSAILGWLGSNNNHQEE